MAVVLFLAVPATATACGACTDHIIRSSFPFAGYNLLFCLFWTAAVGVIRFYYREEPTDKSPPVPSRKYLISWGLAGTLGIFALGMLTMGSVFLPALIVGTIWCADLLRWTFRSFKTRRQGGAARAFFTFNLLCLLLVAVVGPTTYLRARTADGRLAAILSYPLSHYNTSLLAEVIETGPKAVGPLIQATRDPLNRAPGYARDIRLSYTTFGLGRLCGAEAETFLLHLVRDELEVLHADEPQWPRIACFAYQNCAGTESVPGLVSLYERLTRGADPAVHLSNEAEPSDGQTGETNLREPQAGAADPQEHATGEADPLDIGEPGGQNDAGAREGSGVTAEVGESDGPGTSWVSPEPEVARHQVTLLAALARTATPRGVSFALDHLDVLLEQAAEGATDDQRLAQATAAALVLQVDPDVLRTLPVYRGTRLQNLDKPQAVLWQQWAESGLPDLQAISAARASAGSTLKQRWLEALGGPTVNQQPPM